MRKYDSFQTLIIKLNLFFIHRVDDPDDAVNVEDRHEDDDNDDDDDSSIVPKVKPVSLASRFDLFSSDDSDY